MALSVSSLTTGSGAGASLNTASISPVGHTLLTLWIGHAVTGGTTVTGVSGLGLTWTQQSTVAAATSTNFDCWTALCGASPGSGALTISLGTTASVVWNVDQAIGVDLVTPILTSNTHNSHASVAGTTSSLTYNAAGAGNQFLFGCAAAGFVTQTEQGGWVELADAGHAGPSVSIESQISPLSPGTTGTSTLSASVLWACIGIELVAGAGITYTDALSGELDFGGSSTNLGAGVNLEGALTYFPVIATSLTSGGAVGTATSASITPIPNSVLAVWVGMALTGANTTATVSGLSLTWTRQQSVIASISTSMELWTAVVGSSPPTGSITVTAADGATNVNYDVDQLANASTLLPVVPGSIRTATGNSVGSTLPMGALGRDQNTFLYAAVVANFSVQSPTGTGYTKLADQYQAGPSVSLATQFGTGTTAGSSWQSSGQWAAIGLEINSGGIYTNLGQVSWGGSSTDAPTWSDPSPSHVRPDYDTTVLADSPVLFVNEARPVDAMGLHTVSAVNGPTGTYLPNGDIAYLFDGATQYVEIANALDLSPDHTNAFTVEAWLRPDVQAFPHWEASGYVHWLGKGDLYGPGGNQEWLARMYNLTNTETPPRPNRISCYGFNPPGGFGIGSEWQDAIVPTQWIHFAMVINLNSFGGTDAHGYPYTSGYTKIYKNGVLRDQDALDQHTNTPPFNLLIQPVHGNAPVRFGTEDFVSYFLGGIGKVAIYNTEISAARLLAHYNSMVSTWTDIPGPSLTFSGDRVEGSGSGIAPTVAMITVNAITKVSANLVGTVNPNGDNSSYHFIYGTTTSMTSSTGTFTIPSAFPSPDTPSTVTAAIAGLTPGATYYAALVGSSIGGTVTTPPFTFQTLPNPIVTDPNAPLIGFRTATINTPHFAYPFSMTLTGARVVEEDSPEEIFACVQAVANCVEGEWPENAPFGIPDPVFANEPVGPSILDAITQWEPRATETMVEKILDDTGDRVRVTLTTTASEG